MKELRETVDALESIVDDMKEFVVFLQSYPRVRRQPYCTYLLLDSCIFGRQMERERVLNFLLQADEEAPGTEDLAVLPVFGPIRVGKSTLVEHVCKDEKVRNRFSTIMFFRGNHPKDEGATSLSEKGLIVKHQNDDVSDGRRLIVMELAGDMDEEAWGRFSSWASSMSTRSKIIITSRSDKIARLGTTEPLRLDHLPPEAYWQFFKMLAFGSADPDEHPRLASMAMEIAMEQRQCFVGGYIVAGLLRDNLSAPFWRAVLQRVRAYKRRHLLLFQEHPNMLTRRDEPVYYWRLGETGKYFFIRSYYQTDSSTRDREADVPRITVHDILVGSVAPRGKFEALGWRSRLPPYYNYMISCVMEEPKDVAGTGRKRRVQRQALD